MSTMPDRLASQSTPTLFVSTWNDGLFTLAGGQVAHDFAGLQVRGLCRDWRGGLLAIVDGCSFRRRSKDGLWSEIAAVEPPLSCCTTIGDLIFIGTDDAQVLRIDRHGAVERLEGFDRVEGRELWYSGAALVDGQMMGPPLGVRSMTSDGYYLLANVHVGGIPRSSDCGLTWQATIAIDTDVHEVCADPRQAGVVAAASAAGLCVSRDSGATWTIETQGLHANYCSAVAFGTADVFVAASTDHFARQGAVYRRPIDGTGRLEPLPGLPTWLDGIVDTGCIATHGATVAIVDHSGRLYLSPDDGASWSSPVDPLPVASGICLL